MKLVFGILSLLVALWFVAVLVRVLPVGSYKSSLWIHETTWGNVIVIIVIVAVTAGLGIWLIRG